MTTPVRRPLVVGPAVVLEGPRAVLIGGVLRDLLRAGWFDRLPPASRTEVISIAGALDHVGGQWRVEQARRIAESGKAETLDVSPRGLSEPPDDAIVSVEEASAVLGLSSRRVRQLAALGLGVKRNGIWLLHRDAVLAERERREAA